jgi:hypothetical protein
VIVIDMFRVWCSARSHARYERDELARLRAQVEADHEARMKRARPRRRRR